MKVTINAELTALIEQDVAAGRFASAEDYIAAGVELLHEREAWKEETVEALNASLNAAIVEADRDGWLDETEVGRSMSEMKDEWATRRTA
jgi:putative addiction module CopG family antidote